MKLLLIQISCNTLQIVHSLDVLRINQLWVGEQTFKDSLSKLTLGITFFEQQIGLGSLTRQNHICWAIEASKLQIAFGSLLAAWVKKRLPSWYETQIADEDNCGLSVSPLPPSQHWRGHGSRCGVTFHRAAAVEAKNSNAGRAGSKYAPVPCPVATHFVGSSFGSFRILNWERLTKEEVVLSVELLNYVVINCHRIQDCFFASFHWAANKMRFHFLSDDKVYSCQQQSTPLFKTF